MRPCGSQQRRHSRPSGRGDAASSRSQRPGGDRAKDRLLGLAALLLLLAPLALLVLFACGLVPSVESSQFAAAAIVGAFAYLQLLFAVGGLLGTGHDSRRSSTSS